MERRESESSLEEVGMGRAGVELEGETVEVGGSKGWVQKKIRLLGA